MGMFDEIIVPKSYLKSLLTKDQEKLVKDNNYQTKSLENFLAEYKVHRQKLYIKEGFKKGGKWVILKNYTGEVNFYTSFLDKDENTWWTEFNFSFRHVWTNVGMPVVMPSLPFVFCELQLFCKSV